MMLSVVIPAYNEAQNLPVTIGDTIGILNKNGIAHEILVVNDNSKDNTEALLAELSKQYPTLRYVNNTPPNGFGRAIKKGLDEYKGDAVVIFMADGSDSPEDLVRYYNKLNEGYDCVFGSRFMPGGKVVDYPRLKYVLNRMGNWLIRKLFHLGYDDITNAFKCYRRKVIESARPLMSNHFNVTVEIPVKAIIYGYSYAVVPNSWVNRKYGASNLKISKMFKQYIMIIIFLFLKKQLEES
jgi:dolichol-phosphate mannosyltransferase